MLYKVFLVEDEIVTREGIRDNVDWNSVGFELCGEAPDGEIALPLLETAQPDVLITDIKMPFMDGLQLCKIVRERMPWIKIIILSGHDEFHYAQTAVKLGVTEYLLKPLGVQDLHNVLGKVASLLDRERKERETWQKLKEQLEDNQSILREKFLLKLVTGGLSSSAAIEQSQLLGMNIIAQGYLVVVIQVQLSDGPESFTYQEYQQVEQIVSELVGHNPDVLLLKKDLEELVLILKGDSTEHLEQEGHFLSELVKQEVESKTKCLVSIGVGSSQKRISDIYQSFTEAVANAQNITGADRQLGLGGNIDQVELLKLDRSAIEAYLKSGIKDEFDQFFEIYIHPLGQAALKSYVIKNYIFVDILLTTAKFVRELGGNIDQVIPEINHVEAMVMNIKTMDQLRTETQKIFVSTLTFRDNQTQNQYRRIIHQAKEYISQHYVQPELSLNEVAAHVNLSPSHFSTVFSRETGETFKEYLTRLRIDKAKELLRTTSLKSFEIASQIGYNDPHYFSYVFKENTGLSPKEFRAQV